MNDLHTIILEQAGKPGGVEVGAIAAAHQIDAHVIDNVCRRLAAKGVLHKAKISHRVVRWCATAAQAQALVDLGKSGAGLTRERAAKSKAPADAKLDRSLPVVNPNNVTPTVLPCGYTPKYEGLVGSVTFGLQRGRVTR